MTENTLIDLNNILYSITGELIAKGHKPYAIAGMYSMIALQIYKTTMTEQDYNSIVDHISSSRDRVQRLDKMLVSSDSMH